ncbi:MAG: protein kinase domain-containing protein [Planctomycetota bacterium]
MPRIFCQAGKDIGQDFPLEKNMLLGRKSSCTIIVDDDKASREHAKIYKEEDAYYVEDLNSSNGTYLNEIKIAKRRLNFGDKIRIGRTILVFLSDPVQNIEGQTMGGFKIEKNLGARGIGIVYRARQIKLARTVALKVLDKDYAEDPAFVERFIAEARAAGKLRHPGIIQVYDVGQLGDVYYACMEYISGKTLRDTIAEQGTFTVKRVKEIAQVLAEALREAHANEIIHGELNPSNIIMTRELEPKVSELGIPKSADPARKDVFALKYLSPEEAMGLGITPQSDIYALGLAMFEMLEGKPPFEAESAQEIIDMHRLDPIPDLSETHPEIPQAFALMIKKMCLKNLSNRYATIDKFLEDLAKVPTEPKKPKKPPKAHKRASHVRHTPHSKHAGHARHAHHAKPAAAHKPSHRAPGAQVASKRTPQAKHSSKRAPVAEKPPVDPEAAAARDERRHERDERIKHMRKIVEYVVGVSLLIVLFLLSYLIVYFVLSMAHGKQG